MTEVLSLEGMVLVSAFSLAWFIVGVITGCALPKGAFFGLFGRRVRSRENGQVELYVGNLSYDMTEKEMVKAFEAYGRVIQGRIIQNRFNGKSKGYGFVEMADRQEALNAIRALNGKEIKGRRIVVNEAKSSARER